MKTNRRKLMKKNSLSENDAVQHRRSSLRVNLSCASNLSDSNETNWNSNAIEFDKFSNVNQRERLKSKQLSDNNKQRERNHSASSRNTNAVFERVNNTVQTLNKNCEELRHAVLTKTKEIFDKQDELFIKTCTILNDTHIQENVEIANNSSAGIIDRRRTSITTNKNIDSTPKCKRKNTNFNEQRKQSRIKKRQLSGIINTLNPLVNTSCEGTLPKEIKNHGTDCSLICKNQLASCTSNISMDIDTFIDVPIGSSTIINGEVDEEDEASNESINNLFPSSNECTKKCTLSMEMTDAHGTVILSNNQRNNTNKDEIIKSKITCPIPIGSPVVQRTNLSLHTHNILNANPECINESTEPITEDSNNIIGTSLNVNTSVDALNVTDKSNHKYIQEHSNKNSEHRQNNDLYAAVVQESQENLDTIRSSLQMNTSLDTSSRLHLQKKNGRSKSLTLEDTVDMSKSKTEYSLVQEGRNNSTTIQNKSDGIVRKLQESRLSYIEATPYPMSRSVLLKSQWKQNGTIHSNFSHNTNKLLKNHNRMDLSKSQFLKENVHKEQEKVVNNVTILNNSKSQMSRATEDSTEEAELENNECIQNLVVPGNERKHKKKLLPLRECSQLSFSPAEQECLPPERAIFSKRHKRKTTKYKKKKFNVKFSANDMENIDMEVSKQSLIQDDCNSLQDKNKKQRKPRKILSKKIIIKEIVDKDIVKMLEKNQENVDEVQGNACGISRTSSNDFQSLKTLPGSQLSRKTEKRMSIVTTGLSNEDKGIVKSVVKALGMAKIESNVTKRTTHVVTTGVRTINLLFGIIRGCWLVSLEWVLKSLENNAWLNPEKYEMSHFAKAVLENRKDRQLFGSSYVPELFATCGYVYVEKNTRLPCNVLKDLVKTAGGRITECLETAKVVVGAEGLKESWVLDCITTGDLQPYNQYQHH